MAEKPNLRHPMFNKIAKLFNTLQLCFAILFFSCSLYRSSYFSPVFNIFGVFLHRLSTLLFNHHFLFLLGNLIIFTLFIKFVHSACHNQKFASGNEDYLIGDAVLPVQTEFDPVSESLDCTVSGREIVEVKRCRRSRSEVQFADPEYNLKFQLRRSETEIPREMENSVVERFNVDDLSNEEFQREVEAFIERQRRFLREESLAVVSSLR